MKKAILLSLAFLLAFIAFTPNVSAYSGGGGFPPGYFDNPHAKARLECEFITINLPFNRQVRVPRCKMVRIGEDNDNFQKRIDDFLARIRNGGNK